MGPLGAKAPTRMARVPQGWCSCRCDRRAPVCSTMGVMGSRTHCKFDNGVSNQLCLMWRCEALNAAFARPRCFISCFSWPARSGTSAILHHDIACHILASICSKQTRGLLRIICPQRPPRRGEVTCEHGSVLPAVAIIMPKTASTEAHARELLAKEHLNG